MNDSVIVITGSTRGIGYGLADAFLAKGCRVVVTGRDPAAATRQLSVKHAGERVEGVICNVRKRDDVETLWDDAVKRFGRVDMWINNAGALTTQVPFLEQRAASVEDVVVTNLLGTVVGTHVALARMTVQGSGRIFNVEGFGAEGRMMQTGLAVYGSTKCGVHYFTKSIAKEINGGPVNIGIINPGVVVTDMVLSAFDGAPRATWEKSRKLFNVIGDPVDVTAPWLVERLLAGTKNGESISRLTLPGIFTRFLSPSRRKRDLFAALPPPQVVG